MTKKGHQIFCQEESAPPEKILATHMYRDLHPVTAIYVVELTDTDGSSDTVH